MTTDVTQYVQEGFDADRFDKPPYYESSPAGDGWMIGKWLCMNRRQRPVKASTSRGTTIRVDGKLFKVTDYKKGVVHEFA